MTDTPTALLPLIAHVDGYHMDWGDGWWILMVAGMALFWIAVAAAVVWLARGGSITRAQEPTRLSALDVLERRLAEGDVTIEEYRERRTVLTSGDQRPGPSDE
jgi:uncharacterized membrane protein